MIDLEKQHYLLSSIVSNSDLYSLTRSIIKPEYFDPRYKKVIKFVEDYVEKYHEVPSHEVVKLETTIQLDKLNVIGGEFEYASKQIETMCRWAAMEKVILHGANLLGDDRIPDEAKTFGELEEMIKNAISVGLQKDLGLSYFDDPYSRLNKELTSSDVIPLGIPDIDEAIGGGIRPGELLLWGANSGVGKSIFMANNLVSLARRSYNVVYITLEMAEESIARRMDAMFTKIAYKDILKNINLTGDKLKELKSHGYGNVTVKRMPESTTTAADIRAYLKEYQLVNGYLPDFLIVDYLDIMMTSRNIQLDNLFIKDKFVAEELRALLGDLKIRGISASQLSKTALDAEEHHQGQIQGGMSKVQTVDYFLGIYQTLDMRAAGEYVVKPLKTRNSAGVGEVIVLKWDADTLTVGQLDQTMPNFDKQAAAIKNRFVMPTIGTAFDKSDDNDSLLSRLPKL